MSKDNQMKILLLNLILACFISVCISNSCQSDSRTKDDILNPVPPPSPTLPSTINSAEPPPLSPPPSDMPRPQPSLNPNLSAADSQLIDAVKGGNLDEVQRLLNSGANPNSFYQNSTPVLNRYTTVLGLAVSNKNVEIARLLLERGADVNENTFDAYRSLALTEDNFSRAVYNEDIKMMQLLIEHHANPQGNNQISPLIVEVQNIKVLDFLMKHGASINTVGVSGRTALANAIYNQNVNLVKAILKYKPNLSKKIESILTNYKKVTPLELAMIYGNKEIIQELKKAGAKK